MTVPQGTFGKRAPENGRLARHFLVPRMSAAGCCAWLAALFVIGNLVAPTHAAESFSSVYISEFLANNQHGIKDDDGDYSPWIELHNASTVTVNLKGWSLTDTPTNLTKWRFPGVALLPDKSMVLFGSGKDRATNLIHLHTNFRLNPDG